MLLTTSNATITDPATCLKNNSNTLSIALLLNSTSYDKTDYLRLVINKLIIIPVYDDKKIYKTKFTNINSVILQNKSDF